MLHDYFFSVGLHDQGVESDFVWSDGSVVDYTNWDNWNPDNWANSEDCANVRSYNDGRWNDQNCRNSLPYICKKRKGLHHLQHVPLMRIFFFARRFLLLKPLLSYNFRHKLLGRFDHEQNFSKILFILSKYAVIA